MKRQIAVFTGTRAEYGLLYWLLNDIKNSELLSLQMLVTGMHLSHEFGETWKQIESDGFTIDAKVEMLLSSDTAVGVVKSVGLGSIGFADALERLKPELIVILGDRFEALAVAQSALILGIPIAHIHGGEITQGAYDDSIRHAITMMASLHFTASDIYKNRVVQMGKFPSTVYHFGAIGLDHLQRSVPMSRSELSDSLEFDLGESYFLLTYHPVTKSEENSEKSMEALLKALDLFPEYKVIITYPNADNGGRKLIAILEKYASSHADRIKVVPTLGIKRYMNALRHANLCLGNSSSGIIEAPACGVPTVNIGERQLGRLSADSVIHCNTDFESIVEAIETAISPEFVSMSMSANTNRPYGQGNVSAKIVEILETHDFKFDRGFYDLEGS